MDHLALRALVPRLRRGSTVFPFHVLPSVGGSIARPCLGNKLLSFLLILTKIKQTAEYLHTAVQSHLFTVCTAVQSHLYSLYLHTVQMLSGVQINMFSKPYQSHDKLETRSLKFY